MGYYRTLIAVADDCPVDASVVPSGERKTVARCSTRCSPPSRTG